MPWTPIGFNGDLSVKWNLMSGKVTLHHFSPLLLILLLLDKHLAWHLQQPNAWFGFGFWFPLLANEHPGREQVMGRPEVISAPGFNSPGCVVFAVSQRTEALSLSLSLPPFFPPFIPHCFLSCIPSSFSVLWLRQKQAQRTQGASCSSASFPIGEWPSSSVRVLLFAKCVIMGSVYLVY